MLIVRSSSALWGGNAEDEHARIIAHALHLRGPDLPPPPMSAGCIKISLWYKTCSAQRRAKERS